MTLPVQEQQEVVDLLVVCLSVPNFAEKSIEQFRAEAIRSIQSVFGRTDTDKKSRSCVQYNEENLRSSLLSIEWKDICVKHDKYCERQGGGDTAASTNTTTGFTLLQQILDILQNPNVVPICCGKVVAQVLLEVIVTFNISPSVKHRLQWLPSQQRLLKVATNLVSVGPALRSETAAILQRLIHNHQTIPQLHILLSLIKHFIKVFLDKRRFLLPKILDILGTLDANAGYRATLPHPSGNVTNQSSSRRTRLPMDYLHGEISDEEYDKLWFTLGRSQRWPKQESTPRVRDILRVPTQIFLKDQKEADRLKTKCIKTYLASPETRHMGGFTMDRKRLIFMALDAIKIYQNSSSIRLLVLILGVQENNGVLSGLTDKVWQKFITSGRPSLLRFYTDLLIECSYFDNLETLWNSMLPFREKLAALCSDDREGDSEGKPGPYLFALAHLLTGRGKLLTVKSEFASLLAQLSVIFENVDDWVDEQQSSGQKEMTISTLQAMGILGVCDARHAETNDTDLPVSPSLSLIARRIASDFCPREIFSVYSPSNQIPPNQLHRPSSPQSSKPGILNLLNEDCFRVIFGFVGYKRLVRLRSVCVTWRNLADSPQLWYDLYQIRFGIRPDDPVDRWTAPWSELFRETWRVQRRRPGCRLCPYVGCYHVSTTQRSFDRHVHQHFRKGKKRRTTK